MKYDILNRFAGKVQFTAEIEATGDTPRRFKLGMSVKWAVENGADLSGADLSRADLSRAYLYGANLSGADLSRAGLNGADLNGAYLNGAYLSGANLYGAYLYGANLSGADLYGADLRGADLNRAGLNGANLSGADLNGADLNGTHGVNDWIKCIQIDQYPITYTSDVMQIGCERHNITEWREFDDASILEMDGKAALKFWRKYKDWIFQTIELCPAKPTQEADQ